MFKIDAFTHQKEKKSTTTSTSELASGTVGAVGAHAAVVTKEHNQEWLVMYLGGFIMLMDIKNILYFFFLVHVYKNYHVLYTKMRH